MNRMNGRVRGAWRNVAFAPMLVVAVLLAGCRSSHFEPPDVQGEPLMVQVDGAPRLLVLTKLEEARQVGVGGGRRNTGSTRIDTWFHFELQAFDPANAAPLWKQRLMTIGDPDAKSPYQLQTRVIGSSVSARLLGQDGDIVWLLIGDEPFAVNAADGAPLADPAALQQANPALQGLLPSEARHYGFDRGLVLLSADARPWVVRGPQMRAEAYTPTPVPPAYPEGRLKANGMRAVVPMYPFGEIPARQVMLDGRWLGLYSEKEAEDAGDDRWGDNLLYPYQILDEGSTARRTFWRATIATEQSFDERFERLTDLVPVDGAPTFLKGRFLKDLATGMPGTALVLQDPPGVLVWHSTRMDDAGRLALARLDTSLKTLWTAELPLSETGTINPVRYWTLPGHVVVSGSLHYEDDARVRNTEPHLVSIALADGAVKAWNLTRDAAAKTGYDVE